MDPLRSSINLGLLYTYSNTTQLQCSRHRCGLEFPRLPPRGQSPPRMSSNLPNIEYAAKLQIDRSISCAQSSRHQYSPWRTVLPAKGVFGPCTVLEGSPRRASDEETFALRVHSLPITRDAKRKSSLNSSATTRPPASLSTGSSNIDLCCTKMEMAHSVVASREKFEVAEVCRSDLWVIRGESKW